MNTSDPFPNDDALDEEAAAWLREAEEGFSAPRARAFAAWRDCDPRHEAALARVQRAFAILREMPAVRAPLEARFGKTAGWSRVGRRRWLPASVWSFGVAAAVVIGLVVWWREPPRAPAGQRYATDATAQRSVALSDGSVVDINARSDLRVQFTAHERRVVLGAGEGFFKVTHDPDRPFVVTAGDVSVRAIGTAFNVRLAGDSVDIVVLEGKVEVVRAALSSMTRSSARPLLRAGERASVFRDETTAAPKIEKVDAAAVRAMLAWQDRMTSFTDVPLRNVVDRFNRRNATQLVLAEAELGERKIGGVIAMDQVEAFARLLEQDGDIVAERRQTGEIVLRRAR